MELLDNALQQNAADARDRFEADGKPLPSLETIRDGRPLWPFHVLSSYIEDKHAPNLKEAAEALTKLGGTFTADLPLGEVVYSAHRAGGLCILAHPGRADAVGIVTADDLDAICADYALDGLEAHYRSYTDAQTAEYRIMALERGMLISCGSDSHGPGKPVDPRGWKADWCSQLLGSLGVHVDGASDPLDAWKPGMDPEVVPPPTDNNKEPADSNSSAEAVSAATE